MAKLLFVADPIETFKAYKDSTVVMMAAAQTRGHQVYVCEPKDLSATSRQGKAQVTVQARQLQIADRPQSTNPWWQVVEQLSYSADAFDVVLMRKDPPFDVDFLVATQLLDVMAQAGVWVINKPAALRDHGEKLAALEFAAFTPTTMVSACMSQLTSFAKAHSKVVFKPLDAMGGSGIFVTQANDPNLPVILETLTSMGRRAIMGQEWLPQIVDGDKRILLIDGKPVPYALARIPPTGASRGNLAAGGRGEARPLTARDQDIANAIGPILAARGLFLVGLDVIGDHLTEVNVTSPTGFQEITAQTGFDVADTFIKAIEARLA
jgi:glutathione synthase